MRDRVPETRAGTQAPGPELRGPPGLPEARAGDLLCSRLGLGKEGRPPRPQASRSPFSGDNFEASDPDLRLESNHFPLDALFKIFNCPPFPAAEAGLSESSCLCFSSGQNGVSSLRMSLWAGVGWRGSSPDGGVSVWQLDAWVLDVT